MRWRVAVRAMTAKGSHGNGTIRMLAEDQRFQVSFDRKLVELKVRGAEPTLNEHLAKLVAFDVDERTRELWKREVLRKHLSYFAKFLRAKPHNASFRVATGGLGSTTIRSRATRRGTPTTSSPSTRTSTPATV